MKKKIVSLLCVLVSAVLLTSCGYDYEKAYGKTEKLASYETEITTIVTLKGESLMQTEVVQTAQVYRKGSDDMRYRVATESFSVDENGRCEAESSSEYTYYDGNYYISMPGVKYYSPIDFDNALKNITDLTGLITFPYDKMYNVEKEKSKNGMVYDFDVEGEDLSEHVLSLLQSAADTFGEELFKPENIKASATEKGGYVTNRSFSAEYSADGKEFTVEIYTKLVKKRTRVAVPDKEKYEQG